MRETAAGNPCFIVLASLGLAGLIAIFPSAASPLAAAYLPGWLLALFVMGMLQLLSWWRPSMRWAVWIDGLLLLCVAGLWAAALYVAWPLASTVQRDSFAAAAAAMLLIISATAYSQGWFCLAATLCVGGTASAQAFVYREGFPYVALTLALLTLLASVLTVLALRWRDGDHLARARLSDLLQQLAQRRAELRDTEIDRSRFLAAFSHDLKQPMQAINLYIGSIERHLAQAGMAAPDRSRSVESLLRLKQGIAYMNDVFDSVLDISRIDSGVMGVAMERVQANDFCVALLRQHQQIADDLGLKLELRAQGMEAVFLETDPQLLERILRNFLSNAMRYTRKGGIRLRLSMRAGLCRIAVIDTGSGIAASLRKKIFDEFTRGDAAGMAAQGVGLGLSIARRLAACIGGRITLHSHLGIGSVFAIDLPVSLRLPTTAEKFALHEARLMQEVLPQIKVEAPADTLMVCLDSDPEINHALSMLSYELGVDVLAAGSSTGAIQQLARMNRLPGLMLIDAQLQSESALQAITTINEEFNAEIPVILSSDGSSLIQPERLAGSRITLLRKPFTSDKLREAIMRALSRLHSGQ